MSDTTTSAEKTLSSSASSSSSAAAEATPVLSKEARAPVTTAFVLPSGDIPVHIGVHNETLLPPDALRRVVRKAVRRLRDASVPGCVLSLVIDGRIALTAGFGWARLPDADAGDADGVAAQPSMPFPIGSVSKQLTAAVMLLLQEDKLLSLDDTVAKYLPADIVAHGETITLRQLLRHTGGLVDYYATDYQPSEFCTPTTAKAIVSRWAGGDARLDFEPGTQRRYSNTGYVALALIAERVTGKPFRTLLQERIFEPLGMRSVCYCDDADGAWARQHPAASEHKLVPTGYHRVGLAPLRAAPPTAPNWLYANADVVFDVADWARWLDVLHSPGRLLSEESYRQFVEDTVLAVPASAADATTPPPPPAKTSYGLGIYVARPRYPDVPAEALDVAGVSSLPLTTFRLAHDGEASGFCAWSAAFPEARVSIAVSTNIDTSVVMTSIGLTVADVALAQPCSIRAAASAYEQYAGERSEEAAAAAAAAAAFPLRTAPPKPLAALPAIDRQRIDLVLHWLTVLQDGTGELDERRLTDHYRAYLTPTVREDYAASLRRLGDVRRDGVSVVPTGRWSRGGFIAMSIALLFTVGDDLSVSFSSSDLSASCSIARQRADIVVYLTSEEVIDDVRFEQFAVRPVVEAMPR